VRLRTAALPADAVPVQGDGSLVIRHRTGLSRVTVLPHHFSRALAARLGHEAVEAIEKGSYRGPDGQQVDWADEVRAAVRAKESIPPELPLAVPEPSSSATVAEVTNEPTLEAARRLTDVGKKPLVLNFANGVHPGGGFLSGARAQEEALCRSSALWATLAGDPMYGAHARRALPDSTDWAIISPGVPVFRTDDGDTGHSRTTRRTSRSDAARRSQTGTRAFSSWWCSRSLAGPATATTWTYSSTSSPSSLASVFCCACMPATVPA
jgi:hypothetical protein